MTYWFTGYSDSNTNIFSAKLKEFLETQKRNWRKDVFYLKESDVDDDFYLAQIIANFITKKENDIVVDLLRIDRETFNKFKKESNGTIVEIFVYNSRKNNKDNNPLSIENSEDTFILDTCSENANQSFSKLINYLNSIDKL